MENLNQMELKNSIQSRLDRGIEYRNLTLSIAETEGDETSYRVTGYATTFNEPYTLWEFDDERVDEVVDARAFDSCQMDDVIMQYDHQGRVFARTRNNTLTLTPDEHGLRVEADLGGTDIGRQLWQEISGGYTDRMSFGFIVSGSDVTERIEDGKRILERRITGISRLFDVSAVSLPANDGTAISARSVSEGLLTEADAERRRMMARQKLELKLKLMEV